MIRPPRVGAVVYDPKVSVIWEIIGRFFEARSCPINVVFFATYELQVSALAAGKIDIAWNSPLAWLDAQRRTDAVVRSPCAIPIAIAFPMSSAARVVPSGRSRI